VVLRKIVRRFLIPVALWALVTGVAGAADAESSRALTVSTPQAEGVDPAGLVALLDYMDSENIALDGLMILRHDKVILKTSWYPYSTQDPPHRVYSTTKSIVSALIGIALAEGKLRSIDQTLGDFFPDSPWIREDPAKARISVEALLKMASGFEWHESDTSYASSTNSSVILGSQKDFVDYVLSRPLRTDTRFDYNSGGSHLLSAILQKATGMSAADYAQAKLFGPLGIPRPIWNADPQGISLGGNGLALTLDDMAKIGTLFLRRGVWNGRQILDADWVDRSTAVQIDRRDPTDAQTQYGYQWWTNNFGGYSSRGAWGQYIIVLPHADVVLVCTASLNGRQCESFLTLLSSFLLPAISDFDATADHTSDAQALEEALQRLSTPPLPTEVVVVPGSEVWLGKSWKMESGSTQTLVSSGPRELTFVWEKDGQVLRFPIGLDGLYHAQALLPGDVGFSVFSRGQWLDSSTFEVSSIDRFQGFRYVETFHFGEDGLTDTTDNLNYGTTEISHGRLVPTP